MAEENLSQEFRSKNIEETRYHFIKEIDQEAQKGLYGFKMYWKLTYFSFCGCWICSYFCVCFFSWHSYRK